jgi:putative acetyltransferase
MHLRPYQPGEETTLWDLYQGLGLQRERGDAQERMRWLAQLRGNMPFVVEYDNLVIGYVSLERNGEINHFYVRQGWQGRGVGTLLMHKVHLQAAEQGIRLLSAAVCETAVEFFSRWGFIPVAHAHYPVHLGSIAMSKNLVL